MFVIGGWTVDWDLIWTQDRGEINLPALKQMGQPLFKRASISKIYQEMFSTLPAPPKLSTLSAVLSNFGSFLNFSLGSFFDCHGLHIIAKQKLVNHFWMLGHMLFESFGPATWITALWAFLWFFSSVNAEVGFQMLCLSEWAPTLLTVMWLLPTVGEQMSGKIYSLDWRVVAPLALIRLF